VTRTIDETAVDRLADRLYDAYRTGEGVAPPETTLTVDDGYAVQRAVTDRRTAEEGPPVGYKVGFTSEAIRTDLGVDDPAYGPLLADTVRPEGRLDDTDLIDPKAEPELAIRLDEPLDPPVTPVDAFAATSAVVPVIEVVDSRIRKWAIEAGSTVADNVLAARVVHGDRIGNPAEGDRSLEGVVVRRNGERVATGVGADVMGGPFRVVSWLAGALADRGERLTAGDLVSTGSLTPLVPFEPGDTVEARFSSLGSVTVARPPVDSNR
jgi:2-keto-4-pentenoate hydratase